MRDATTGEVIAEASSAGIDFAAALDHAREVGGPALRALTFHERAGLLKALAKRLAACKEELYALSYRTGATRGDSWIDIDGGIGTVFSFASKASRELPNAHVYLDGAVESLSKAGTFVGRHLYVSRGGCGRPHQRVQFSGVGNVGEARTGAARRRAGDRQAGDRNGVSDRTRGAPHRRVRHLARRRAAARLRQSWGPVRSPELPGHRFVHRLGGTPRRDCVRIRTSCGTRCRSSRRPIR